MWQARDGAQLQITGGPWTSGAKLDGLTADWTGRDSDGFGHDLRVPDAA